MNLLTSLRRVLDPRRSIAARLLFGFFLVFFIPVAIFVLLLDQRLTALHEDSTKQVVSGRRAEASAQVSQDALSRAAGVDRRVAVVEEAGWSLAESSALAIGSARSAGALADYARTRGAARALASLPERHPEVSRASLWTLLDPSPHFPAVRPIGGDSAVWGRAHGPYPGRVVTLYLPIQDGGGRLLGGLSIDVDARRYVEEALGTEPPAGDLWFAVDGLGQALLVGEPAARLLDWRERDASSLEDSPDFERRRLARAILSAPRTIGDYRFGSNRCRLASARIGSTGWVFVEGLSSAALARIEAAALKGTQASSFSDLERFLILLFLYLSAAVLAVVVLMSRRISAPISELVHAAEEIGAGRAIALARAAKHDELGRLAAALKRMSRRVERRVETLRRLHSLLIRHYPASDFREILARSTEAIAAFTRAERVCFFLHDPRTNRLEAAFPGWNLPEELVARLQFSVESRSIVSRVFHSGEAYISNDLERDPNVDPALLESAPAQNAIFCPLRTEEQNLGVVMATNRPDGFGPEEADAVTSFADAASLLIRNARLYETLHGTVEELRRATRLKDQFLQNVNHELRTPLTSIVGWTDLLEEQEVDAATLRRGLKQARQSARVLLALIDDLLDLGRMDRGILALDLKPVVLADVIQRALESVRLMAEGKGVVLIVAPLPEEMPKVRGDALRLQQVVWNLLGNAIKFTARHGRVIVRLEREPGRYLVGVEDDGVGIPESDLPHIFERFRQADGSATRTHSGMGIGLALARSLVELHGGTIWAESRPGRGSRITFSLPIPAEGRMGPVEREAGERVSEEAAEQSVED